MSLQAQKMFSFQSQVLDYFLPGNQLRVQEVTGPNQDIIQLITPRETVNSRFYILGLNFRCADGQISLPLDTLAVFLCCLYAKLS